MFFSAFEKSFFGILSKNFRPDCEYTISHIQRKFCTKLFQFSQKSLILNIFLQLWGEKVEEPWRKSLGRVVKTTFQRSKWYFCRKYFFHENFVSFLKLPRNLSRSFSATSQLNKKTRQVRKNCISRVQRRFLRQLHFGKKCLVNLYGFWGTQSSNKLSRSSWLGSKNTFHVSGATFWTSFFLNV